MSEEFCSPEARPEECPYDEWTIENVCDDRHADRYFQRRSCARCGRCVIESLPGECPSTE
jgi:hypothetical protein